MRIVISPYHLTTREPPAMAALLLATRAVTLMPVPPGSDGRAMAMDAAQRSPRYLRFVESWRWTVPLWNAGVLRSGDGGEEAADDVLAVCQRVHGDERLAPLREFVRPDLYADADRSLDAVAADLLKAGPDPGVSVPVAAGLDRFASRHAMVVARSGASSVVQRAEERLGQRLAAVAIPVVIQGDGRALVEAAGRLAETLGPLRSSLADVAAAGPALRDAVEAMRYAAREYETEFADRRAEILALGAPDEAAVRDAHVTLTLMRLPADAALDASLEVLSAVLGVSGVRGAGGAPGRVATLPALSGGACVGPVTAMLVRALGRSAPLNGRS